MTAAERPGPPRASVRAVELDDDISLYDAATGSAALLNATAAAVWRLLDGQRTVDDIVDHLAGVYDADPDVIRQGVRRTIDDLASTGFLAS